MARTKSFQQDILSARKSYGFRPNSDVCLKKTLTKHCNVKMIYLVAEWMQLHAQFFVPFPISTGVCVFTYFMGSILLDFGDGVRMCVCCVMNVVAC